MRNLSAFLLAAALVTVGFHAHAQECSSDADCPTGLVCEGEVAEPCADIICADGEECPEPEPCDPEVYSYCVPAECTSDADCGEGLECLDVGYTVCSTTVVDCAPEEECPEPEPADPECEEHIERYCLPTYVAPCEVDADCGDGFECLPEPEMCECSSGGFVPPDDEGYPDESPLPPEDDPDCTCEPSDLNYCSPIEVTCADDSECPDDWTCEDVGHGDVPCTFDPETGDEDCGEPEPTELVCLPPFFELWHDGGSWEADYEEALADLSGTDEGGTTVRISDEDSDGNSADEEESSSGCQAAPGSANGAAWLLPLLLFLFRRR